MVLLYVILTPIRPREPGFSEIPSSITAFGRDENLGTDPRTGILKGNDLGELGEGEADDE